MPPSLPSATLSYGSPTHWQHQNAAYLHAAIVAVVARLRIMAASYDRPAAIPAPYGPCAFLTRRGRRLRRIRRHWNQTGADSAGPDPVSLASVPHLSEASMARIAGEIGEWPPALARLVDVFSLTSLEREIVVLCAAVELDTRAAGLCARAQDDPRKPYPTLALAMALFDDTDWTALSPERPLLASRMIEVHQPGVTPLASAALKLDPRIANYLRGHNHLDERLAAILVRVRPTIRADGCSVEPSQSQSERVGEILVAWEPASLGLEAPPVIHLVGPDPGSKRLVALAAARGSGRKLYALEAATLAGSELDTLARLWEREARLMKIALYLDNDRDDYQAGPSPFGDAPAPDRSDAVASFLQRAGAWTFVASREPGLRIDRPHRIVEACRPNSDEQVAAWAEAIGFDRESLDPTEYRALTGLASQYPLDHDAIHDVVARVTHRGKYYLHPADLIEDLWNECRILCRPHGHGMAQRIDAKATWDQLVLPERPAQLLRTIVEQVRHRHEVYYTWGFAEVLDRGLGLSVLFAGESGTGKTMAAEVIANELDVDLYKIDLSSILSKYIGDVEKNLKRVFDAFEDSGAILFFDEADSLYGKRTEIKDSHDRYANIAVNYLLQRIEAYRGLAILATNFKSALDPALSRRLRFVVDFPQPGLSERAEIWRRVFPEETPLEDLDAERLARLPLNGGSIRVVALNAAFAAAAEDSPFVAMRHLLDAARDECVKLGKAVPPSEFLTPGLSRRPVETPIPEWQGEPSC